MTSVDQKLRIVITCVLPVQWPFNFEVHDIHKMATVWLETGARLSSIKKLMSLINFSWNHDLNLNCLIMNRPLKSSRRWPSKVRQMFFDEFCSSQSFALYATFTNCQPISIFNCSSHPQNAPSSSRLQWNILQTSFDDLTLYPKCHRFKKANKVEWIFPTLKNLIISSNCNLTIFFICLAQQNCAKNWSIVLAINFHSLSFLSKASCLCRPCWFNSMNSVLLVLISFHH